MKRSVRADRGRTLAIAGALLVVVTSSAILIDIPTAGAATLAEKCQDAIVRRYEKYVRKHAKLLGKCNDEFVADGAGASAPAGNAAACDPEGSLATAAAAFRDAIADRCVETGVTIEQIQWPSICPDFERRGCDRPIDDTSDIADCLLCLADRGIGASMDLYYGHLVDPQGDDDLVKCQRSIGRQGTKLLLERSRQLVACRRELAGGEVAGPCPTGEFSDAIAQVAQKGAYRICNDCGGTFEDGVCTQLDEAFQPAAIGFPEGCVAVDFEDDRCEASTTAVDALPDITACVQRTTEADHACVDRAGAPHQTEYPPTCNCGTQPCGDPAPPFDDAPDGYDDCTGEFVGTGLTPCGDDDDDHFDDCSFQYVGCGEEASACANYDGFAITFGTQNVVLDLLGNDDVCSGGTVEFEPSEEAYVMGRVRQVGSAIVYDAPHSFGSAANVTDETGEVLGPGDGFSYRIACPDGSRTDWAAVIVKLLPVPSETTALARAPGKCGWDTSFETSGWGVLVTYCRATFRADNKGIINGTPQRPVPASYYASDTAAGATAGLSLNQGHSSGVDRVEEDCNTWLQQIRTAGVATISIKSIAANVGLIGTSAAAGGIKYAVIGPNDVTLYSTWGVLAGGPAGFGVSLAYGCVIKDAAVTTTFTP